MDLSIKKPSSYLLSQLTFMAFYFSATYAVLLWSPNSLGRFFSETFINIILILPFVMLWLTKGMDIVQNKEHRTEIALMIIIIILGIINILYSDNPFNTYKAMKMFLLSGIIALWVSMFLLKDPRAVKNFDWFCCFCLAIIVPTEILGYFINAFSVVTGAITMSADSLGDPKFTWSVSWVIFHTTMADTLIVFSKLFIAHQIVLRYFPNGVGRLFTLRWWIIHLVGPALIFAAGYFLWR